MRGRARSGPTSFFEMAAPVGARLSVQNGRARWGAAGPAHILGRSRDSSASEPMRLPGSFIEVQVPFGTAFQELPW